MLQDILAWAGAAVCAAIVVAGRFDGSDGSTSSLCVAALSSLLIYLWRPSPPLQKNGSVVPGPGRSLPFIGCTLEFDANFDDILGYCTKQCQKYGWGTTWGFSMLRIGALRNGCVYLATPAAVQHVLKDNFENYEKGEQFRSALGDFLGNGIFASDGPVWRHHRKVAVNMFSKRLLQEGMELALEKTHELVARLDKHAESGKPVDLQQCYFAFTMDTFCSIAFGTSLNSQDSEHRFSKAFDTVQMLCNNRFRAPWWELCRFVGTTDERTVTSEVKIMREFALGIVHGRRRDIAAGQKLGPDLLSRFLAAAAADPSGESTMDDDELIDIVLNFIIAGRDTTACALSWGSLRLIRAETARENMRQEVLEAVGGIGQSCKHQQLQDLPHAEAFEVVHRQLPYTRAVMSEVLRLHPSVPKDGKYAVRADVLPDGTQIAAGCCTLWSNYCMGRDPTLWPEPLEFRPERWLLKQDEQDVLAAKHQQQQGGLWKPTPNISDYTYPVFNAGPRLCLGRPLAYMEMAMMIAVVFGRYDLQEARHHTEECSQTLVSPMKHGLHVTLRRRKL